MPVGQAVGMKRLTLRCLFALGLLGSSACQSAPGGSFKDYFQPYLVNTLSYDDNLFRLSGSLAPPSLGSGQQLHRDDLINQATVGSAINYPWGRQQLVINLRVSDNRFVNNSFLNHVSTNDRAAWQWQLGKQWSGDVGYVYTRAMGGFTNTNFFGLDIITGNNVFANVNYAWHPRWVAKAGANWQQFRHGASDRKALDQDILTGVTSVTYTTPSNNSVGLQYIYLDGQYPNQELNFNTLIDNGFQQHNPNALLTWKPSQKTNLTGTFGYTVRQYPDLSRRNFDGETWNVILGWNATAKVMFSVAGWRQLTSWVDQTATYIITEGFSLSPQWQITPKLALTAKFIHQSLDYAGDISLQPFAIRRHDTVLSGQVSVVYTPLSNAEITLGYMGGTRETNGIINNRPQDYDFNSVYSSAMWKF